MAKAVSYVRFSSAPQGKGSTTERQNLLIDDWFSKNPDIERSGLSQQDLGISGFRGKHLNHGLGRILHAIEQEEINDGDFILVEAVDRIGRLEPFEMMDLIRRIVAGGVTIVTLEDGQIYSRESLNNEMASLYILIGKIQQAHHYSQTLSRRLSAAYERKRRKARKGEKIRIANAFWLKKEGTVDPDRGEIVRKCIDLYLKGHGTRRIILTLREEYPLLAGVHPTTLKRWFSSRALIGEWQNGNDPIAGVFEPLVNTETFYLLQHTLAERAKQMSPEQTYDLSGIVVCGRCGGRFYYRRKKHNDYTIIYANCSTYLKRGMPYCDNNRTWAYEVLRAILQLTMANSFISLQHDTQIRDAARKVEILRQQEKELNQSIERLLDVISAVPDQQNTLDRLKELDEAKKSIRVQIRAAETAAVQLAPDEEALWDTLASAEALAEELSSDPIALRETLKRHGYRIVLDGSAANVKPFPESQPRFSLEGRSTKHNCYLVKADVGDIGEEWEAEYYLAVDRKGVISVAFSRSDLEESLSNPGQRQSYAFEFGDGLVPEELAALAPL